MSDEKNQAEQQAKEAQERGAQHAKEVAENNPAKQGTYEVVAPIPDPIPDLGEQGENDDEDKAKGKDTDKT